ncbi:MAG TPA: sulfotransferase [Gaiellaceae bacterium]
MNPYVFFVGCSRSGTTLLRRIGDAHPDLAIVREQHWLPRYWEWRIGVTPEGFVTPALLDMLLSDRRFPALEVPFKQVAELVENGRHYSDFVTELFDLHGRIKGKGHVGEKTPKYVRHLQTLVELWPHAKVVHLIRDGRDVALSLLDWDKAERNVGRFRTWDDDPVTTAALYWEWNVRLGREAGEGLGSERYFELRYEALVGDPEGACLELCRFLGIPYDPSMLRFHEGRARSKPGLSAKKAWRPVTAGLRSWRDEMAAESLGRFEVAVGDLLQELGYARSAVSSSAAELEDASAAREAFVDFARSAGWRVPRAWEMVAV